MGRRNLFWAVAAAGVALGTAAPAAPRPTHATTPHAGKPQAVTRVPTAAALYGSSLDADDHFSYRGRKTRTAWRTGHTVAVMVYHRAPAQDRIVYLSPERQTGGEIIADGHQKWEYDPAQHVVRHSRLPADADSVADAAAAYSLLKTNYSVAVAPQKQSWAGRKAFLLTIRRAKNNTLIRKLWIDAATGLVLKWESYRAVAEGKKIAVRLGETDAYTDIDFHPKLSPAIFDPGRLTRRRGVHLVKLPSVNERPIPLPDVPRQLGGAWVTPPALAGYQLVSAAITSGPPQRLHLRYSDGLNLVSLFEQRRTTTRVPTRVPHSRPLQVGRVQGHVVHRSSVTLINWDAANFNFSLMGEIAEKTLLQLAATVDGRRP